MSQTRYDIVICGGSFVGLTLARALTALAPGAFSMAIIERQNLETAREGAFDGRSAALIASVKAMLDVIGIWPAIAAKAQPVNRIELTDSELEAPIRPALIGLDAGEGRFEEPTSYILENSEFRRALFASLEGAPVTFFAPAGISSFAVGEDEVTVRLDTGATLETRLLVAADGQNSLVRESAGIPSTVWRSAKVGIVATVQAELPHGSVARQHFLPAGPFAALPMTGNRLSIVWTEHANIATELFARGKESITAEIAKRIGPELGHITLLSEPKSYPLTMTLARAFVKPRVALTGDAAHGLHWIAGQGLNHGMKDVAALSETLIDARRLGLDIGTLGVLKRYERWRRFDSASSAFGAAAINTLFSNDNIALRMVRSTGLRTVDRLTRVKTLLMKEAAGLTGDLPKLLRGQPI